MPLVQIEDAISACQRVPEGFKPAMARNKITLVIWMLFSPDCSSWEKETAKKEERPQPESYLEALVRTHKQRHAISRMFPNLKRKC